MASKVHLQYLGNKSLGKTRYRGDGISVSVNSSIFVSEDKANQLLTDFPDEWDLLEGDVTITPADTESTTEEQEPVEPKKQDALDDLDEELEQYHTGHGWYELPNREKKVQKSEAQEALIELIQSGE